MQIFTIELNYNEAKTGQEMSFYLILCYKPIVEWYLFEKLRAMFLNVSKRIFSQKYKNLVETNNFAFVHVSWLEIGLIKSVFQKSVFQKSVYLQKWQLSKANLKNWSKELSDHYWWSGSKKKT